jgi:hypothetical protein
VFHYDGETEEVDLLMSSEVKGKKREEEKFDRERFY